MISVFIGAIVGIIMGLTGAGGAMISIPLFISLLSMTLKEASTLSLITVVFGTVFNLMENFSKIETKLALILGISGVFSNYLSLPFKSTIPETLIITLLTLIGTYSIFQVWQSPLKVGNQIHRNNQVIKAIIIGSLLGVINTFTGLGGGVLLIPVLINFFAKSYQEALPTSLATIFIISLSSFLMQFELVTQMVSIKNLLQIMSGTLGAYFILKCLIARLDAKMMDISRRIIFTIITAYSLLKVIVL